MKTFTVNINGNVVEMTLLEVLDWLKYLWVSDSFRSYLDSYTINNKVIPFALDTDDEVYYPNLDISIPGLKSFLA
jgi:hypothetical protein